MADWTIDLRMAPEAAVARVASAINRPKKRLFGVLKTSPEYVGVAHGASFEVWERRDRAVRAVGGARAVTGGTQVEATFRLAPLSRAALVLFFPLYALVAAGLANLDGSLSALDAIVAIAGVATIAAFFIDSYRRQRQALRGFLEDVLRETPVV